MSVAASERIPDGIGQSYSFGARAHSNRETLEQTIGEQFDQQIQSSSLALKITCGNTINENPFWLPNVILHAAALIVEAPQINRRPKNIILRRRMNMESVLLSTAGEDRSIRKDRQQLESELDECLFTDAEMK